MTRGPSSHERGSAARGGGGEPRRHPGRGTGVRLWLLRHAEVHPDWHGRAYGSLDVPLSAAGRRRTLEAADDFAPLAPVLVVGSPLERARRLALGLARRTSATLVVDERLREIDRGLWQGRTVAELHEAHADEVGAFYADPWSYREHRGESDAMVSERAWAVVDELLCGALHDGLPARDARVVLATHYNVIRVLTAGALGVPPARSFALRVDPGRGVALVDGPDGWTLVHANVSAPPAAALAEAGG